MKKEKIVVNLLILLTVMSCFLSGCGSTSVETTPAADEETQTVTEEETQASIDEETTSEPEQEVTENVPEEEETTAATETATDAISTEEEVEETVMEEAVPVDVEEIDYLNGYSDSVIVDYMETLNPDELCIVIYNYKEHYVVNMKEGQHYSLKANDEVYTLFKGGAIGYGYPDYVETRRELAANSDISVLEIDYSKMSNNQEFFVKHLLDSGEIVQLTIYLDPPAEE